MKDALAAITEIAKRGISKMRDAMVFDIANEIKKPSIKSAAVHEKIKFGSMR
jgi:stage III sporulation protein SpoIIIAA